MHHGKEPEWHFTVSTLPLSEGQTSALPVPLSPPFPNSSSSSSLLLVLLLKILHPLCPQEDEKMHARWNIP